MKEVIPSRLVKTKEQTERMSPMKQKEIKLGPKVSLGLVINSIKVKNSFTRHPLSFKDKVVGS